jgi:hypothetical protein
MATAKKSSKASSVKKAAKKPAAKKPAVKKATVKKAAAKKAPIKKAAVKKVAAKAPTKKAAPAKKPTAKIPSSKKTGANLSFTPPEEFTEIFTTLEAWANHGKLGSMDFEVYQSFNEQYKPSDWNRKPEMDKIMFTFAMDGAGGQFTIWQNGSSEHLEELPVVLLGNDGSMIALTQNVPEFFYLLAAGIDPSQLEYQGISGKEKPKSDFLDFVKKQWPSRSFATPKEIFANAKKKLQASFESFLEAWS